MMNRFATAHQDTMQLWLTCTFESTWRVFDTTHRIAHAPCLKQAPTARPLKFTVMIQNVAESVLVHASHDKLEGHAQPGNDARPTLTRDARALSPQVCPCPRSTCEGQPCSVGRSPGCAIRRHASKVCWCLLSQTGMAHWLLHAFGRWVCREADADNTRQQLVDILSWCTCNRPQRRS